ncbi:MAG: GNAT family N-acetyltransferase [Acidobacteriota bacterium]
MDVTIRLATNEDLDATADLVARVLEEFALLAERAELDRELASLLDLDRSGLWLAHEDGRLIGSVAIADLGDETCELKRMYLVASARGRGVGKRLFQHALDFARVQGYRAVLLDTDSKMETARAMYRRAGFVPRASATLNASCDTAMILELETVER